MVANILAADLASRPPPIPLRPRGPSSFFSEHGHIAYQIKKNHE